MDNTITIEVLPEFKVTAGKDVNAAVALYALNRASHLIAHNLEQTAAQTTTPTAPVSPEVINQITEAGNVLEFPKG